jgi:hypothetical protein
VSNISRLPISPPTDQRIPATDIAAHFGFRNPSNIRYMIERNLPELLALGTLPTVVDDFEDVYYLNQPQASFLMTKANNARHSADSFSEDIVTPVEASREQLIAQALLLAGQTMQEQSEQIAVLTHKAEALDQILSVLKLHKLIF